MAALWLSVVPAHADSDQFKFDVQAAGFTGASPDAYLQAGNKVCTALVEGYSKRTIATSLYENTDMENLSDAMQLVNIAHRDLCPGVSA